MGNSRARGLRHDIWKVSTIAHSESLKALLLAKDLDAEMIVPLALHALKVKKKEI